MVKKSKKSKSKRVTLRKKYKIIRRVKEHHRKKAKEAKKLGLNKKKKIEKDPGIPNDWPFKQQELKALEDRRARALEELEQKKAARKERAKKRKLGLIDDSDVSQLASEASAQGNEYANKPIITELSAIAKSHDHSERTFYKELKKVIEASDVILEVLDARDPLGTRSIDLENMVLKSDPNKRIVLLLNKIDLVPREAVEKWLTYLRGEFPTVAFKCSTQEQRSNLGWKSSKRAKAAKTSNILQTSDCLGADTLLKLLKNYSRSNELKLSITVGIVGLPNVGKSSLINSLKRSHAVNVGATPGLTKSMQEIQLDKKVKLLDCPGVVMLRSGEADASIALRNCKRIEKLDDLVGPVNEILKLCPAERLMSLYKLATFSSIDDFLQKVATTRGKLKKGGVVDIPFVLISEIKRFSSPTASASELRGWKSMPLPLPLAASVPPRSIFLASSSSSLLSRFKFFLPVSPRFYALHRFPSPPIRPRPSLTTFLLKTPSPLTLSIRMPFSTATAAAAATPNPDTASATTMSKKKARRESPEFILRRSLDMCSKNGDLPEALRLYDAARAAATPLSLHLFNVLLYLCSSSSAGPLGLDRGFEIYHQMGFDGVAPNEATFTSLARLAAAKEDPDLAFDLVKEMASAGIPPKLRSFGPALFGFCKKGEVEKAHEVEAFMTESNVEPEETELAALLRANVQKGGGDDVYRLLHRLRTIVRRVSESTADTIESWFNTEAAEEVGVEIWDIEKVKKGIVEGGGGWHGQGWLGKGRWNVGRTQMDETGVCRRCGEKLVCIDIDPAETEDFANSLAKLASVREARVDFTGFKDWLDHHGPFDAVLDAANIGLNNQKIFNFFQLNSVVNGMRQLSPSKKLPLIILHSHRVKSGPAGKQHNKRLLDSWRMAGVLYATPPGSNDDWYWLYAAVRCRSLLVTNDEMRDHLFELLGTSFFPRWKEKHQVRLTFSSDGLAFHMPPPYSVVIQESEDGRWHIPTVSGDDVETPRQWICSTRNTTATSSPPQKNKQNVLSKLNY